VIDVGLRRPHRGPRDIEMRPWVVVVDKALQELRGGDRTAVSRARLFFMSANCESICLSYSGPSGIRQTFSPVSRPTLPKAFGQFVIVGEHAGISVAEAPP